MKCCRSFVYNSNKGDFIVPIYRTRWKRRALWNNTHHTYMHACKHACILAHRQGNRHSCEKDSLDFFFIEQVRLEGSLKRGRIRVTELLYN